MAFTKAQLEALKNTLLASNQPILASQHRQQVQGIIDEMYDAQSRGNILVGVQSDTVSGSSDTFLVFRSGQAYQLPVSLVNANDLANLGDVFINDLQDGDSLVYDAIADRWENRSILLGFALSNLTDVELTSLAGGDILRYNAVDSKWENVSLASLLAPYALLTDLDDYQLLSAKGEANGYASLDSGGKVPLTQINDAILGQVSYQGTWNASTNTPTLANPPASTTKGEYYVVSAGGTFAGLSFEVGDWIISNGTAWEKVNNTDAVRTVFGRLGDVVANAGDYSAFYVTLDTIQTVTGQKTFNSLRINSSNGIIFSQQGGHGIPEIGNTMTTAIANDYRFIFGLGSANYKSFSFVSTSLSNNVNRALVVPDASGTIALTSDLGDFVTLSTAQTITATKTFNNSGSASNIIVNHTSGSGIALDITKGGNGEGIRVNKTGGSGNAATIIGTLEATTLVKTGGTASQFLKADGSIDSNTYVTTHTTQTITGAKTFNNSTLNIAESGASGISQFNNFSSDWGYDPTVNRIGFNGSKNFFIANQNGNGGVFTFSNPASVVSYAFPPTSGTIALTSDIPADNVTGTGTAGQVSFWTGAGTQGGDSGLVWDNVNKRMGINTSTPLSKFEISHGTENTLPNISYIGQIIRRSNATSNLFVSGLGMIAFENKGYIVAAGGNGMLFQSYDGTIPTTRWEMLSNGILQSNGAQTIQTSTGNLTLATAGGNGSILINPNGSGNVGINTSTPDVGGKLTVAGTGGTASIVMHRTNTGVSGGKGALGWKSVNGFFTASITEQTGANDDTGSLVFRTMESSSVTNPYSVTERMRITSSGNVGIGTANPSEKLDVNGNIKASSFLSDTFTVSVPNNTATTILELGISGFRNTVIRVSVTDVATHIMGVADVFVNWNGATYIVNFTQIHIGLSTSVFTLSGSLLQFRHTFGSTRALTVRYIKL